VVQATVRRELDRMTVAEAFAHVRVVDLDMARACLAGVWLLHDYLAESHTLSQSISTPTGSYWHGLMHRREGDFSNAKYWFRKVGEHPVFDLLVQRVQDQVPRSQLPSGIGLLVADGCWDPFAMVDACQASQTGQANQTSLEFCRDVQQWEWELLFAFCYGRATG
jgi:hypothetical protein